VFLVINDVTDKTHSSCVQNDVLSIPGNRTHNFKTKRLVQIVFDTYENILYFKGVLFMWIFFGVIFAFVVYFMTATKLTKRWLAERKYKTIMKSRNIEKE